MKSEQRDLALSQIENKFEEIKAREIARIRKRADDQSLEMAEKAAAGFLMRLNLFLNDSNRPLGRIGEDPEAWNVVRQLFSA